MQHDNMTHSDAHARSSPVIPIMPGSMGRPPVARLANSRGPAPGGSIPLLTVTRYKVGKRILSYVIILGFRYYLFKI